MAAGEPGRDAAAGVEHDDRVGDGHDEAHVVLDQHDGRPGGRDPPQGVVEPPRIGGIETGRRFVEQQNFRRRRKRAGDLDQTAVDVRQGAGRALVRPLEADEGEQRAGEIGRGHAAPAPAQQTETHVVEDAQAFEHLCRLKGARQAAARQRVRR